MFFRRDLILKQLRLKDLKCTYGTLEVSYEILVSSIIGVSLHFFLYPIFVRIRYEFDRVLYF